jgi:PTH1 family peptidyl-tRNA hydrolase
MTPSTGDAWVVSGLGNPGPAYAGHRHNVGAMVLDELAERVGGRFTTSRRLRSDVVEARFGTLPGTRVVLAKPRSYVNESGGPVTALLRYHGVPAERLVVVHDELDLPFEVLRLKRGGGDNGHNGLRSVRAALGTGEFHRVRVGIGRPPGRQDPADFVLRDFTAAERRQLGVLVATAADAVEVLVRDGLEKAQNQFNG